MIDSSQFTFCKNEIESLEHLIYSCKKIRLEPLSVVISRIYTR